MIFALAIGLCLIGRFIDKDGSEQDYIIWNMSSSYCWQSLHVSGEAGSLCGSLSVAFLLL